MKLVPLVLLLALGIAPLKAQTVSAETLKAEGKAEIEFCQELARGAIASRNGPYITLRAAFMDCLITRFQWKALPAVDAWKQTEKEH